ncbi:MAG: hypothetical protein K0S47_4066 [Herbinix sp.]|jgi:hypothetical protein|nr:hypothetical protein [Herbinix sp.]
MKMPYLYHPSGSKKEYKKMHSFNDKITGKVKVIKWEVINYWR